MLYRLSRGMSHVQVYEWGLIRGLTEGLQIPWWKSRDMTSWSCGGDLERCLGVGVVTWDEHDRSSGSRDVT